MSSGGGGSQTVTQRTVLPDQYLDILNYIQDKSMWQAENRAQADIVPGLSDPTNSGLDMLTSNMGWRGRRELRNNLDGDYLNSNPYASETDMLPANEAAALTNNVASMRNNAIGTNSISGVQDAITQAATKAVGDRFSQAGRTGSPGEGMALAGEVSRQLAPYAFNARESDLQRGYGAEENRLSRMMGAAENRIGRQFGAGESALGRRLSQMESAAGRGFSGYENERARMLQSIAPLFAADQQEAQNYLNAGSIIEDQQRRQAIEPFERLNMRLDPLMRVLGATPTSTATTQPVNRNQAAGILGGASTGAGIASALGASTPWGIAATGLGGILGAL